MAISFASYDTVHSVLLTSYSVILSQPHCETVREGYREADRETDSVVHSVACFSLLCSESRADCQPIYFWWPREYLDSSGSTTTCEGALTNNFQGYIYSVLPLTPVMLSMLRSHL